MNSLFAAVLSAHRGGSDRKAPPARSLGAAVAAAAPAGFPLSRFFFFRLLRSAELCEVSFFEQKDLVIEAFGFLLSIFET